MLIDKGNYKLYNGDCLEVMDGLIALGVKFDAIVKKTSQKLTLRLMSHKKTIKIAKKS